MNEPVDSQAVIRRLLIDFQFYCESCLKVEDYETGQLIPFVWKPVQRKLARLILQDWVRGAPVRLIILKARREGVSTLIQAFFFWVCSTREHRRAYTVAHDDDTASFLHGMSERFYENLPAFIQPQKRRVRRGSVLEFANPSPNVDDQRHKPGLNSSLQTVSQKNAGAGKGATKLHLSEVALWQPQSTKRTLDTILQVVPRAGQTMVVLESTARGMGNEFHSRWLAAEDGRSGYTPVFFPWSEEPTYRIDPEPGFERTPEEEELAFEHGLDDAQLQWRRKTLEDECGGDEDTLHQEYPLTPSEAFLATGRPYFNQQVLARHEAKVKQVKPWKRGNLVERKVDGKKWAVFEEDRKGLVTIWHPPEAEEDYLIFAGASECRERSDSQPAYVFSRSKRVIVAAWHGRVDRDLYGDELYMLGKLYGGVEGEALIAVETSGGWGNVPVTVLRRRGYHRIYKKVRYNQATRKREEEVGFKTTTESRPLMLDSLKQALRQDALEVNDPGLIRECMTFNYDDTGKPQAEAGAFDDRVIAASGGCWLWETEPRKQKLVPVKPREPASAVTGY